MSEAEEVTGPTKTGELESGGGFAGLMGPLTRSYLPIDVERERRGREVPPRQ